MYIRVDERSGLEARSFGALVSLLVRGFGTQVVVQLFIELALGFFAVLREEDLVLLIQQLDSLLRRVLFFWRPLTMLRL